MTRSGFWCGYEGTGTRGEQPSTKDTIKTTSKAKRKTITMCEETLTEQLIKPSDNYMPCKRFKSLLLRKGALPLATP